MHVHRRSPTGAFAAFSDLVSECGSELILLTSVCACMFVLTCICVYKFPAVNEPPNFVYGILKSALLRVVFGRNIRTVLAHKTVISVVVHDALS